MRAVVLGSTRPVGTGRVSVEQVAEPVLLHPADALVRVQAAGVCGTDLHAVAGHLPGAEAGTRLGHEYVGEIVELGAAVTRLSIGNRVVGSDFTACGTCWYCTRQAFWHCSSRSFLGTGTAFGNSTPGAQAELVRVPFAEVTLAPLPASIDARLGVLMSDNLATAFSALDAAALAPSQTVAVIGGGPVGQLTALAAQLSGAGAVVLSDPVPARRQFAAERGSLACEPDDLAAALRTTTEGRGADIVVEAVGGARGLEAALAAVRPGGRIASVSAHSQTTWPMPLADTFAREVSLAFVIGDPIRMRPRMLAYARAGLLDQARDLVELRGLHEAAAAYADMSDMTAMKIALVP